MSIKTQKRLLWATLASVLGLMGWGASHAQDVFTKYGPVAGIQKSTGVTYVNTAAASTDVSTLFCSSSTTNFLRADGACAVPAGTTAGANPTATVGPTATNGVATTFMRSDAAPAINLTTPFTWTALHSFNGGIASSTFTAHGVLLGEGASAVSPVVMGADTVLRGTASADPVAAAVPNCGSGTTALNYNTTTHAFGCQTLSGATLANPTALVGLTAVNGTATSAIRSDGAPALDQSIAPTMTGAWTFTPSSAVTAITINQNATAGLGQLITGSGTPVFSRVQTTSASNGAAAAFSLQEATDTAALEMFVAATTPAPLTGGPTGEQLDLATNQNVPLVIGTNGVARMSFAGAGGMTGFGPTANALIDMTPDQGTFTATLTGCTAVVTGTMSWRRVGGMVYLYNNTGSNITCTSNATTFTMTGLPAAIQATQLHAVPNMWIVDNTNFNILGEAEVQAGTITFSLAKTTGAVGYVQASAFTATGTKGIGSGFTIAYPL